MTISWPLSLERWTTPPADVARAVRDLAGAEPDAVVFLGLGPVARVVAAFEQYAPLVGVGSYVVVENTIVNGRPVASGFGPGPFEAVVDILGRHREFFADPTYERYTLTFNRNGYLRRMAPTGNGAAPGNLNGLAG